MMFSPVSIANYFIKNAIYEGVEMTPMKVLKLVYIAHGWHLGLMGKELITDQVEAWKYGPVIPSVYQEFKRFGNTDINGLSFRSTLEKEEYNNLESKKVNIFLDRVWEVYKSYSGLELSELTHKQGTPWYEIWEQNGGKLNRGAIIPNHLIQQHYLEKMDKNTSNN